MRILGSNLAGRIEAVAQAVSQFEVGDEICGNVAHPYTDKVTASELAVDGEIEQS